MTVRVFPDSVKPFPGQHAYQYGTENCAVSLTGKLVAIAAAMQLCSSIDRVVTSHKLVRRQCVTAPTRRLSGVWQAKSRVWTRHSRWLTSDFNKQSTWLRALHKGSQATNKGSERPQKPLVILIGWLGAKERHFNKYAEMWQRMGHKTFGYQPPTHSIVLPPIGSARAAEFIRDVQSFQNLHLNQSVIYHIFSNAGFLFFGTVLRAIAAADALPSQQLTSDACSQQHNMLQPVKGLILDSAPCRLTPSISARGFTAAVLSKPAESIQVQHPHLVSAAQLLFTPVLHFPPIANRQNQIWQAWSKTAPLCPQLYLYSSADALIPPAAVQQFQEMQKQRGLQEETSAPCIMSACSHSRMQQRY
ncbi:hypothetical protein WJX77_000879 [Trebouxia sp. C0004]